MKKRSSENRMRMHRALRNEPYQGPRRGPSKAELRAAAEKLFKTAAITKVKSKRR